MESNVRLKQIFGKVLVKMREDQGVSQQEVADNCNLERAYISRLERGLLQPTITTIFKLADFFEVEPGEIINKVHSTLRKKK